MNGETAGGAAAFAATTAPGRIVFERMAATLVRAARLRRIAAAASLLAGAFVLGAGLWLGRVDLIGAGAMALASVPWLWAEAVELADRAEGLRVLAEDWSEPGPPELVARRRAGLLDLVERLYPPIDKG
ncbi:MAG: hypothetical protein NZ704_07860 [Geminicoccaceae bacterium]|nr:hypothetical protein [Geminicoccaceae bacterium]